LIGLGRGGPIDHFFERGVEVMGREGESQPEPQNDSRERERARKNVHELYPNPTPHPPSSALPIHDDEDESWCHPLATTPARQEE